MTTTSFVSLQGTNYFDNLNITNLNTQIQQVTAEISTGKKATVFGQLNGQDNLSLSLHAQDDLINGYQNAISNVQVRTDSMDSSMTNISTTISNLVPQMNTVAQGSTAPNMTELQTMAQTALQTIQQQLNNNTAGDYVFGGALNNTAPIADTTAVTTNVTNAISNYSSSNPASAIITQLNNLTPAQMGYNPNLAAAGQSVVRADDNTDVNYTVKADEPQYQQAMTGIAEIANLAYSASDPTDFWSLFNDAKSRLTSAATANNTAQGQLGVARNQLASLSTSHGTTQLSVESNIANVENADVATASTNLQDLTTQLQATYSAISKISQLSILNYLPTTT